MRSIGTPPAAMFIFAVGIPDLAYGQPFDPLGPFPSITVNRLPLGVSIVISGELEATALSGGGIIPSDDPSPLELSEPEGDISWVDLPHLSYSTTACLGIRSIRPTRKDGKVPSFNICRMVESETSQRLASAFGVSGFSAGRFITRPPGVLETDIRLSASPNYWIAGVAVALFGREDQIEQSLGLFGCCGGYSGSHTR